MNTDSSLIDTASARLTTTFTAWAKHSSAFPDVVDTETGAWHSDDVNANGAAGLLAGAMWSLYKLTGSELWRTRAQSATRPLLASVHDLSMGQALATLTYPALR